MRVSIVHFTHVDNVDSIVTTGQLRCDTGAQRADCLQVDIGMRGIKQRRREIVVSCGPGGVVADYVPFYFAPRSPMLYSIHMGNVPEYREGQGPLVYLCTDVGTVRAAGRPVVFCDGNCAKSFTQIFEHPAELADRIDWDVMQARMWNDTPDDPDRMRRRMAEAIVHEYVPVECFSSIVCKTNAMAERVTALVDNRLPGMTVRVEPAWYY